MPNSTLLTITAVGDISFRGRHQDLPSEKVFSRVRTTLDSAGLAVANLESPLVPAESLSVPGKCTLRGTVQWAEQLKKN